MKLMTGISKSETNSCISAFNSINVEYLANAVDRFKRIPNYNDLLKENTNLKQALNEIRKCCEENSIEVNTKEYGNLVVTNTDDILQIIDKSLGGSDE